MNPLNFFRRSDTTNGSHPQAHMTWASRSFSHSMRQTRLFLRRQLWIWPIIAVLLLSIIGFGVQRAIESTMKSNMASQLQTLLDAEMAMMTAWCETQESNATSLANSIKVRELSYQLLDDEPSDTDVTKVDDLHRELQKVLSPALMSLNYVGYFLTDREGKIVTSSHANLVGQDGIAEYAPFLKKVIDGDATVSVPFPSVVMMKTANGQKRSGEPTMYVAAPLRDINFEVVGALAFQVRPEEEFTEILQIARIGESGETYAFDRKGMMVSNSRFDNDLILLGLLPDNDHARSILSVLVRDPGGNVTEGFRSKVRRSKLPPTKMAASAIAGESGCDVEGYRDYRGVPVVGAWAWSSRYDIGLTTEMDVAEAFRPLTILRTAFWSLYSLLIASAVAIFAFTVVVARLRREAQKAVIEAKQLGQYSLDEELGAGSMGVVFKGHHSMLRRPTAIKMLNVDNITEQTIARFEREVQITCKLNHPNTIAIYDYGRTPEGVFYYAMEYLDGIDLQQLVNIDGPQSEGRVIHILRQVCGSLFEAHSSGLVHRDVKPANIMLNRRGCKPDFVKVLDFGLVKNIESDSGQKSNALAGTPLYMSPEAIQSPMSVDARSDIYAVGAVGYFLLTGKTVFTADGIAELCQKHVDETPIAPSARIGKTISQELESAIMACLDKSRSNRPQTARELSDLLEKCPHAMDWSIEWSEQWWARHEQGASQEPTPELTGAAKTRLDTLGQTM